MADNPVSTRAYVNHGRWVAHCATPSCAGAERVWPGGKVQHRDKIPLPFGVTAAGVLHCANCGRTSSVEFPVDRKQINKILGRRPVPETRNWFPGETVEDLNVENTVNGVN
jgi:hypothetical protein